ncbi:hypothetical protein QBC38DRAFT_33546 [Podospora fimiseda]|uniref:Uncharacterized protein n=1 Tax=Podospora fimiseda TaxID=252190 RepID=A0AAN7H083_9PEZI|nr:hypothetical protein QBC38DRAFT_33546 [Podospora fimiseda]
MIPDARSDRLQPHCLIQLKGRVNNLQGAGLSSQTDRRRSNPFQSCCSVDFLQRSGSWKTCVPEGCSSSMSGPVVRSISRPVASSKRTSAGCARNFLHNATHIQPDALISTRKSVCSGMGRKSSQSHTNQDCHHDNRTLSSMITSGQPARRARASPPRTHNTHNRGLRGCATLLLGLICKIRLLVFPTGRLASVPSIGRLPLEQFV